MQLTANQMKALRDIGAGLVSERNCGTGAFRIMGPSQPGVVGRVISLGLARWAAREGGRVAVLTDKGKAALPF